MLHFFKTPFYEFLVSNFDVSKPTIVHSDLLQSRHFITTSPTADRNTLLNHHSTSILSLLEKPLVPAFNYDFPKNKIFDVLNDPIQLGPLNEYMRSQPSMKRTQMPIFSFLLKDLNHLNLNPSFEKRGELDPFDSDSVFSKVISHDGYIYFYGAGIQSATIIHFIERMFSKNFNPLYRYDKIFSGDIIENDLTQSVQLKYHVRPKDLALEYDWPKLESLLNEAQSYQQFFHNGKSVFKGIKAKELCEIWKEAFIQDPLAFLDKKTRENVDRLLQKYGRRFLLTDFEDPI